MQPKKKRKKNAKNLYRNWNVNRERWRTDWRFFRFSFDKRQRQMACRSVSYASTARDSSSLMLISKFVAISYMQTRRSWYSTQRWTILMFSSSLTDCENWWLRFGFFVNRIEAIDIVEIPISFAKRQRQTAHLSVSYSSTVRDSSSFMLMIHTESAAVRWQFAHNFFLFTIYDTNNIHGKEKIALTQKLAKKGK